MRGLFTSEFWSGGAACVVIVLVAAQGSRSDTVPAAIEGIALMVSTYIIGRSLIKAVREWRRPEPPEHLEPLVRPKRQPDAAGRLRPEPWSS